MNCAGKYSCNRDLFDKSYEPCAKHDHSHVMPNTDCASALISSNAHNKLQYENDKADSRLRGNDG